MRDLDLYRAAVETSHMNLSTMSLDELRLSSSGIDEEIEISVGDVQYLLVADEQNVQHHKVRKLPANLARILFRTPTSRARIHRCYSCT